VATDLLHSLDIAGAVRSLARGAPQGDMFLRVLGDAVAATGGRGLALIDELPVGFRHLKRDAASA
jgi:hypothetical protein